MGPSYCCQITESESHSVVFDSVISWTITQSLEFCRPQFWSGQPFPSPGDLPNPGIEPWYPSLQVDSLPAEPQGKSKKTGLGCLSLFQGIFLTQELNWGLLHCRQILYQLSYEGSPLGSKMTFYSKLQRAMSQYFLAFGSDLSTPSSASAMAGPRTNVTCLSFAVSVHPCESIFITQKKALT